MAGRQVEGGGEDSRGPPALEQGLLEGSGKLCSRGPELGRLPSKQTAATVTVCPVCVHWELGGVWGSDNGCTLAITCCDV